MKIRTRFPDMSFAATYLKNMSQLVENWNMFD